MELKYGVGIDISKDKFDACISVIDSDQHVRVKATHKFENKKNGFDAFLKWVHKHQKSPLPIVFLMEATGVYYENLAWFLHTQNCTVCVVLANKARKYKDALGLRSKTDKIDANALAQMCCQQHHTPWKPFSNDLYLLRMVTRQIQKITEESTVFKNQLHALRHGMVRDKGVEKMLSNTIALLKKNKTQLEKRVKNIVESEPVLKAKFEKILTIKGLGLLSLATIVAETNGFTAFESISQLVSYAGYDVIENQSGKRAGKTRISKRGNSHIRRILYFPSLNMVRYEIDPFMSLYNRVFDRTKISMKGYTAIQKKLLSIIYTLWKKDEAFDSEYYKKLSGDKETESSFGSVPKEPVEQIETLEKVQTKNTIEVKKVTPTKARVTQDRHPVTSQRMSSFG